MAMRELTDEEKQEQYVKITDATANLATAIITLRRGDLMQRQLDLTTELLEALGVKAQYDVNELMANDALSGKPLL